MKLEDFRENNIGKHYIYIKKESVSSDLYVPMSYHDHAIKAFYFTCQDIEQFENIGNITGNGKHAILSVAFWYISIESYINTILKILCFVNDEEFSKYKGKTLDSRISKVFSFANTPAKEFYQTEIYKRLSEFECFRNEIFHDRTIDEAILYHKTKFSGLPFLANLVDSLQAMIISLEVFNYFKKLIPRLNLMPNIVVQKEDSFYFEKLDYLYMEFIVKIFTKILKKHSISTELNLFPELLINKRKAMVIGHSIVATVKAIQESKYTQKLVQEKSNWATEYFNDVKKKVSFDINNSFLIANYTDENNF